MKIILSAFFAFLIGVSSAKAATVSCSFMSETSITTSGVWLKEEMDLMKFYDMFGDGLSLPLENSLLANLDTEKPFEAGKVDRGTVYLMGGDMGITGKLINVDGNVINVFDGMCSISFG